MGATDRHDDPHPETSRPTVARPYVAADASAVAAMHEPCFGRARTEAEIARRLDQGPGGPGLRFVLAADDEVVGHLAIVPLPAWFDGRRTIIGIVCDAMVLPTWQGAGRFGQLADVSRAVARDQMDLALALTADRPLAAFERYARSRSPGRLAQWVRWHSVGRLERSRGHALSPASRALAIGGIAAQRRIARLASTSRRVDRERPADDELDQLARNSVRFAPRAHIRDARYVAWRWPSVDDVWSTSALRDRAGRLAGWVVHGMDPRRSAGTGVIGDILASDPRTTVALLHHAAEDLASRGAEIVTFAYRDPRRWAGPAVVAAGFLRRGVGPPILTVPYTPAGAESSDIDTWYLTSGELI